MMATRLEATLGILVVAIAMYYIFAELQVLRKQMENVKTSLNIQSDHIGQLYEKLETLSRKLSVYLDRMEAETSTRKESAATADNLKLEDNINHDGDVTFTQDQSRITPPTTGIPPDAVLHPLTSSLTDKCLILHCIDLKYDKDRVNTNWTTISENGELVNRKFDIKEDNSRMRLHNIRGTLATLSLPKNGHPQYWELSAEVILHQLLKENDLILETGVCLEEDCDNNYKKEKSHSYGMTVQHVVDGGMRWHGWTRGVKVNDTFHVPLLNRPGSSAVLHYGIVVDEVREKIAFIDINKLREKIVADLENEGRLLMPVFAVYNTALVTVRVRLVVGRDIVMTEDKKRSILQALLDT